MRIGQKIKRALGRIKSIGRHIFSKVRGGMERASQFYDQSKKFYDQHKDKFDEVKRGIGGLGGVGSKIASGIDKGQQAIDQAREKADKIQQGIKPLIR
jgi:hypothetical protein